MGACRFEHLCQSVQCSDDFLEKLSSISSDLKTTMSNILATELSEVQWRQATLPLRHGGIGIRDPSLLYPASRWSSLESSRINAIRLGAFKPFVNIQVTAARQQFYVVSGLTSVNFNKEQKMQVQLVDILTQVNKIRLMSSLTGFHVQRLSSLQTPHAISWATGFSTWFSIQPEASRAALKWALG